jgi:hypothetical protein
MSHPSAPYCTEAEDQHRPEEATREPQPWPSAIPISTPLLIRLRLRFLPRWARHVPYSIPVPSNRRMVLGIELSRSPVMAPPRDSPSGLCSGRAPPPAVPDPIWAVYFESNGHRLKIPFRPYILLKRPCVFLLCNPQSKAYFRVTYYPFESVVWSQLSQNTFSAIYSYATEFVLVIIYPF